MGKMADGLAWLKRAVSAAVVKSEREDLLDELDSVNIHISDLEWQRDQARKHANQIRAKLRSMDGDERRAASLAGDQPTQAEGKNVHELQARFANKHPELAEQMRVRRYDDFHAEYWSADVRLCNGPDQVAK